MNALPSRERLEQSRVLVVGDAMLDRYWFGAVDRISPEAPVPVVRVHPSKEQERLGGAANVAWNVKSIGAHPSLLTTIGDDEHGRRLEALLDEEGIETLFSRDPRLTTTVKLRVIGRSQQLLRIDFEEEPDHEVLTAMQEPYERALATANVVLFSDYGKGGLTHILAHDRDGARRRTSGAGRSEGQRLQPLRRRDRDHAEPRRAGPGDRRLEQRGATARARPRRCANRSGSRRCC